MNQVKHSVIEQLIETYYRREHWHTKYLDRDDAYEYFKKLLAQGNILFFLEDNELLGYVEFWRVNEDQLLKILDDEVFCPLDEDVRNGDIVYIANMFIYEGHRNGEVFKSIYKQFYRVNYDCSIICGEEKGKRNGRIRIFKNMC